ncbi:putative RNA methyltransferase [Triangularia verruculosa]|uniref:tRNA (uracil(54)-C(5))-methyltransferase n=1 Tax=Triangularia verruculosa TaxID=2587418 RepID=A0AAN6XKP4_9PEZI|nr:putative RNA methyltransferase [Triangularia verruculosa]
MRLGGIRVFSKGPSLSSFSFTSASLRYSSQSHSTRLWFTTTSNIKMASAAPAATGTGGGGEGVQQIDSYKLQQKQQKSQTGKRPFQNGHGGGKSGGKFKKKGKKAKPPAEGGHEEVLLLDIKALQAKSKNEAVEGAEGEAAAATEEEEVLPEQGSEVLVEVVALSSTGDGLAKMKGSDRIYVVPFAIPGDMVMVKAYRHEETHTIADFISVVDPSPLRDDSRIQCQYFAKCSGCQFQMLDYPEQLRIKRQTVVKAYQNFSQLPPELVPEILDTIGSPLQYNYRTKLTPHFDGPWNNPRRGPKKFLESCPPVGFTPKASRKVMDIEDCPIATPAVRAGLKSERERMKAEFSKYSNGATILLRENTTRLPIGTSPPPSLPPNAITVTTEEYTDYKSHITDNNATSTEYIDNFIFTNPAGSFFQNNNSILSPFTQYIREHILPPSSPSSSPQIKYLIDAYSGSGLFTITQSSLFPGGSIGIDIAEGSINYARKNAKLNNLDESQCKFIAADAPELFKSVSGYNPDETVVVLDPPRKGCDSSFLRQLLKFGPRRVVYVSCNVHTQARDVGVLVRGEVEGIDNTEETDGTEKKTRYEIESLRGFDFFPQTAHVEGVAVLNRVEE